MHFFRSSSQVSIFSQISILHRECTCTGTLMCKLFVDTCDKCLQEIPGSFQGSIVFWRGEKKVGTSALPPTKYRRKARVSHVRTRPIQYYDIVCCYLKDYERRLMPKIVDCDVSICFCHEEATNPQLNRLCLSWAKETTWTPSGNPCRPAPFHRNRLMDKAWPLRIRGSPA